MRYLRENFFSSWASGILTVVLVFLFFRILFPFLDWAIVDAVWSGPATACRAKEDGACWAYIHEKHRFILFGTYPFDLHWRPALATLVLLALWIVSAFRKFWRPGLAAVWLLGLSCIGVLMWGGVFGLAYVENERWGGLILTLLLASFGMALAFPLAIVLALGRRSRLPVIRALCVGYIELIRGVPLISLLFMASVMLPLFLPEGLTIDKLLRAQVAIILFAGAYLAEVIRGGLQAIPKGQYEAADALGLSYWRKTGFIVLPQALKIVIPPMVNTFIGMFKDTSLVLIIGIYDLLNAAKTSTIEPKWQGFSTEAYAFVAIIYFVFCFAMSKYSQKVEAELSHTHKR